MMKDACSRVVPAWGFDYKTYFVWDKRRHNFGHYSSVQHEGLLVAVKGSCTPEVAQLHGSVVQIERTKKHSEKPEYFREMIDRLYPSGNRLELFGRKTVPGWAVWGNELRSSFRKGRRRFSDDGGRRVPHI